MRLSKSVLERENSRELAPFKMLKGQKQPTRREQVKFTRISTLWRSRWKRENSRELALYGDPGVNGKIPENSLLSKNSQKNSQFSDDI